jgi:redox-sensitive bicupin YhaK (pirin superfamily)
VRIGGSGVKHDEVPTVPGTDCHGFQTWINHAKQMDFGEITDERVAEVENILNNRPRKRYGFYIPN